MSSDFDARFLEDNFLSEDDWACYQRTDFSSFNIESGFEPALSKTAEGELTKKLRRVSHCESSDLLAGGEHGGLLTGLESPPLTPPDDQLSPYSSTSSDLHSSDDILALFDTENISTKSFSCEESKSIDGMLDFIENGLDDPSSSSRARSQSSESSSSTSAYSSQSSTPPPGAIIETDVFDQAFASAHFSEGLNMQVPCVSSDEGFCENSHTTTGAKEANPGSRKTHAKLRKNPNPKQITQVNFEDSSDFDRKVAEALRETNRLLRLHNVEPAVGGQKNEQQLEGTTSSISAPRTIDLKKLCDKVILHGKQPNEGRNSHEKMECVALRHVTAAEKRKSGDLPLGPHKKLVIRADNSALSPPFPLVTNGNAPVTVLTSPQSSRTGQTGSILKVPSAAVDSTSTAQVIIKEEFVSSGLVLPCDAPKVISVSSNAYVPRKNPQCEIPINQTQFISVGENDVANSGGLIVSSQLPGQPGPPLSCHSGGKVDTPAGGPPLIKLVSNGQKVFHPHGTKSPPRLLPSFGKHQYETKPENFTKSNKNSKTPKPLMCSVPGPKKPIIPAVNMDELLSPPSIVSSELSLIDGISNGIIDAAILSKRQQRMIKNRESACQSRQRKKEYVTSLEHRMQQCIQENVQLREENIALRKRISDLEEENAKLRILTSFPTNNQRRAAALLMLVCMVAFNVQPLSFLANQNSDGKIDQGVNGANSSNWPAPVRAGYHGRQLLSHEEQTFAKPANKADALQPDLSVAKSSFAIEPVKGKQFWVDDLVKDCKKRHFGKIQELLQDSSSLSLQRLLRRKLKEELGIRIPYGVPRRIAYAGAAPLAFDRSADAIPPDNAMALDVKNFEPPNPPPTVKRAKTSSSGAKRGFAACEQPGKSTEQLNETESARVSDDLEQWIQRHKNEQKRNKENNSGQNVKSSQKVFVHESHKEPSSVRSNGKYRSLSSSKTGVAIYQKRDDRLKRIMDAIDRKNDTVYVISFTQDHILLPAMTRNRSSHTKMAIVLPTIAPNDSYVDDDTQTMIQINCEVMATEYFNVKREALWGDFTVKRGAKPPAMHRKSFRQRNDFAVSRKVRGHPSRSAGGNRAKGRMKTGISGDEDDDKGSDEIEL